MDKKIMQGLITELRALTDKLGAEVEGDQTPGYFASDKAQITVEQIRAILADKSRAGKTAEVRKLLNTFGVTKLSEVDPEQYPEILKASRNSDGTSRAIVSLLFSPLAELHTVRPARTRLRRLRV